MTIAHLTRMAALPGFGNGYAARLRAEELDHIPGPWSPPGRGMVSTHSPNALRVLAARRRACMALDHADTALACVQVPVPQARPTYAVPAEVLGVPLDVLSREQEAERVRMREAMLLAQPASWPEYASELQRALVVAGFPVTLEQDRGVVRIGCHT